MLHGEWWQNMRWQPYILKCLPHQSYQCALTLIWTVMSLSNGLQYVLLHTRLFVITVVTVEYGSLRNLSRENTLSKVKVPTCYEHAIGMLSRFPSQLYASMAENLPCVERTGKISHISLRIKLLIQFCRYYFCHVHSFHCSSIACS
jgi:hypothetical protein